MRIGLSEHRIHFNLPCGNRSDLNGRFTDDNGWRRRIHSGFNSFRGNRRSHRGNDIHNSHSFNSLRLGLHLGRASLASLRSRHRAEQFVFRGIVIFLHHENRLRATNLAAGLFLGLESDNLASFQSSIHLGAERQLTLIGIAAEQSFHRERSCRPLGCLRRSTNLAPLTTERLAILNTSFVCFVFHLFFCFVFVCLSNVILFYLIIIQSQALNKAFFDNSIVRCIFPSSV